MGLREVTDRDAVLKALGEFDELGREQFLKKYGFRRSRAFYVRHDDRLYDSKPVLSAAHSYQHPDVGPLTWSDFRGGESTTKRQLEEIGFEVVRDLPPASSEDDEPMPIGEIIDAICELQLGFTAAASPEMQERHRLVTREGPRTVRSLLPQAASLPFSVEVLGKNQQGSNARIPYIRVFSKAHSPSATAGWYIVLLFAADGTAAYLTLGTGATILDNGHYKPRSAEWLAERVKQARQLLAPHADGLVTDITLADPGGKGEGYERSTVFATRYPVGDAPTDEDFAATLDRLITMLSVLYKAEAEPGGPTKVDPEWLQHETLWPPAAIQELLEVLQGDSPQVILAGPPGTSKSWVALAVAKFLTGDDDRRWRLVQFHPSYGYESFIQGLRPVVEDGAVHFKVEAGTVVKMADAAREIDGPHVLIMDELNRANIPRVLGELMFLFEYRNRRVDLQYTPNFTLPENLAFIATMNTADRSIRTIDVALRRRFEIFELLPDPAILKAYYDTGLRQCMVDDLVTGFETLNAKLEADRDRHHTIGQAFFMSETFTPARLRQVWRRKIQPLIEEYFFDDPDRAAGYALHQFWPSAGG